MKKASQNTFSLVVNKLRKASAHSRRITTEMVDDILEDDDDLLGDSNPSTVHDCEIGSGVSHL
jgi:hypothetical protein